MRRTNCLKLKEEERRALEQHMHDQMQLLINNSNGNNNATHNAILPTKQKSSVKRPTLEHPEFHGNWMKWSEFWQLWNDVYQYRRSTHSSSEVSLSF